MTSLPALNSSAWASTEGVIHRRSSFSVNETLDRLSAVIDDAGAKLFTVIDQSAEADLVNLQLRDTVLVIFGNPVAGTTVMEAAPLSALDLPLKILIWVDDQGGVWMSYLSADWLARRYKLSPEMAKPLMAAEIFSRRVEGEL
jgi:uncharacterized protein (DUF302 family)